MPAENVLIEVTLEVVILTTFNTSYRSGTDFGAATLVGFNRYHIYAEMVEMLDDNVTFRQGFDGTLQEYLDADVSNGLEITVQYFYLNNTESRQVFTYVSGNTKDYQAFFDLINTNNDNVLNNDVVQTRIVVLFTTVS